MKRRLRSDDGFTAAETVVASMLGAILLSALCVFLMNTFNAGAFTQGQSETINDARNVLQKIEKEVRGADSITWCTPSGSCLLVGAQTPTSSFKTIRYTHTGTTLTREEFDTTTGTWSAPLPMIERVANTGGQPVFACDTASTLLRVMVDLRINPTPQSTPVFNVQTSIRPRNFPSRATCP